MDPFSQMKGEYLAIIEFGFRRIWRILQIKEDVIHLGPLSTEAEGQGG